MKKFFSTKKFWIITAVIAVLYLFMTAVFMNRWIFVSTWQYSYPLVYKLRVSYDLFIGLATSVPHKELVVLTLSGLLTGANLFLLFSKFRQMEFGRHGLTVVSGSMLGVLTAGCAACGLPLFSILGTASSASVAYAQNTLLSGLSLILLFASFYYLAKNTGVEKCEILIK